MNSSNVSKLSGKVKFEPDFNETIFKNLYEELIL
jgi:hypothetical protein